MPHHSLTLHRYEGRHLKLVGTLLWITQENVIFLEDELFTQRVPEFIEQDQFEHFYESSSHELAPMVRQLATAGFKQTSDSCLLACIEYEPDEFSLRLVFTQPTEL